MALPGTIRTGGPQQNVALHAVEALIIPQLPKFFPAGIHIGRQGVVVPGAETVERLFRAVVIQKEALFGRGLQTYFE